MELSKNKIKYFSSFAKKKNRDEEGKFVVEGNKMVAELLHSNFVVDSIVATPEWLSAHKPKCEYFEATKEDISRVSLLQNPQDVWALARMKEPSQSFEIQDFTLALDGIQDPGNMGTIIRLADWFGIQHIVCSKECVDVYNPKVVQATMGAIFRVQVHYVDLPKWLSQLQGFDIAAADMEGDNVYTHSVSSKTVLVMGNEGNGISDAVSNIVNRKLHIPSFNTTGTTSESLNVAVATAILCSEIRRKNM